MTSEFQLSQHHIEVLRDLRNNGCAVCVFLPHEMDEIDTQQVEDAMCEAGWRQIEWEHSVKEGEAT